MAGARVSQVAVEALHGGAAAARVSQVAVEALHGGAAAARVSQVVVEALYPAASPASSPALASAGGGAASWAAGSAVAAPGLAGAGWPSGSALASVSVSTDSLVGDVITSPTLLSGGAGAVAWAAGSELLGAAGVGAAALAGRAVALASLSGPGSATLLLRAGAEGRVGAGSAAEWRWLATSAGALRVSSYSRSRLYSVWYPRRGGSPVPICYVLLGYVSSELNTGQAGAERRLWVQLDRLTACEFSALELAPDGIGPAPPAGRACTAGLPIAEYYTPLEFSLRAGLAPAGYAIHPHGYDWRLSCLTNGRALADRIRSESTPDEPCALVCHSMGGLVARMAWADLARTGETALVRRIVTIGAPHRGSYGVVTLFSLQQALIQQLSRIKAIRAQAVALLNPAGLVVPSPEGELVRITATWPATYELMPALDDAATEDDPLRPAIYDPARWPGDRGVSPAWLSHARDVWGPALRDPAALPSPHVLTTVAGYGVPTPVRLARPERLGRADALESSDQGDGVVAVDSALLPGSVQYRFPGLHDGLHLSPQVLGAVAGWVLEERAPDAPAPPPTALSGPLAVTPVGPPLDAPQAPAGSLTRTYGLDC